MNRRWGACAPQEGLRCDREREGLHTTEELSAEVHLIEGVDGLIVVGLDLGRLDVLETLVSHDCGFGLGEFLELQAQLRIQECGERWWG